MQMLTPGSLEMTDLAVPEGPRESTECTLTDSNQFEYIVYLRQTGNASFISFSQYSKIRPGLACPDFGPARCWLADFRARPVLCSNTHVSLQVLSAQWSLRINEEGNKIENV